MANRQYIGARYVPKFADVNGGVWDDDYAYEPLTIVKHGTDFYTSKRDVPVGIQITDTTYWVKTGDYNGAIQGLQDEIDALDEKKTEDIPERCWLFMGDSYDTLHPGYSWIEGAAGYLGISSSNYYRRSAGGRGFYPTNPSYTWLNYLIANPVDDPDKITDIVICGGANDVNAPEANIEAGIQAFDIYVRGLYPNLKRIYLGFIGWQQTKTNRNKMVLHAGFYRNNCIKQGWRYLDGVENIMKNSTYIDTAYTDYQHPTTDAVEALAIGIANAISMGTCETYGQIITTYTAYAANVTHYADLKFTEIVRNGNIVCDFPNCGMGANQALSGDFIIGTCEPDENAMNVGTFYPVQVWVSSLSTMYSGLLYWNDVGELHLYLQDGASIASGVGFRLVANHFSDIIWK